MREGVDEKDAKLTVRDGDEAEDGWRPQSPRLPSGDEAIEIALRRALDEKIRTRCGSWVPPGHQHSLTETERASVVAEVSASKCQYLSWIPGSQ